MTSTAVSRRSLTRTLSLSGLAYLGFRLTGCGPATVDARVAADGGDYVGATVTMYDLRMEAWSTLGSGQLGFTGTLKASQIKDDRTLDLPYTQDPHGHAFTLSREMLRQLRKGEPVRVITTEALGHTHEVRIDPVKNRVPGSDGVTMPVDPDATEPQPTEKLFATLDDKDRLYAAGSAAMEPDSLEYCTAPKDRCAAEPTLWQRMNSYVVTGRSEPMFVAPEPLPLDAAQAEHALSLRGRLKAGGMSLTKLFKLVRP